MGWGMNEKLSGIGMTSQRTRTRMLERLRAQGIADEVVLTAMAAIPRHIFVDEALASRAYDDVSLPIGFGQTISQPYTVARMTELARNGRELRRVLEIGTGCGYQAAVLGKVAKEVITVERIAPIIAKARKNLRDLRLHNVKVKYADGRMGLVEMAPFDAIVMTAAATHIPQELLLQLAIGGRLVMPIGTETQRLTVVERTPQGFQQTDLEEVKFVPLLPGVA
jgi:protein-L-isoaspartate(D-aspartate) O-methyltransferase